MKETLASSAAAALRNLQPMTLEERGAMTTYTYVWHLGAGEPTASLLAGFFGVHSDDAQRILDALVAKGRLHIDPATNSYVPF